tara:strand:- start:554 stop:721 length:168 start_codon:yes stop_codon:yes gene_type:complete
VLADWEQRLNQQKVLQVEIVPSHFLLHILLLVVVGVDPEAVLLVLLVDQVVVVLD